MFTDFIPLVASRGNLEAPPFLVINERGTNPFVPIGKTSMFSVPMATIEASTV